MLKLLDRLEEIITATLILAATLVIFAAVIHRYSAGIPALFPYVTRIDMAWAQELAIYLFVWMAKFGAAYGVRTGIHVGVDVFVNLLGASRRHKVILFGLLCGALFTGTVGTLGARFVMGIAQTGQTSNDLEVPMWIVYLAVPLGSYLMCFRFLQVAYRYWNGGELPHHDAAHVSGLDPETPPAGLQQVR